MFLGITGISNPALDIIIGVLFTLATLAVLFFAVYFFIKYANKEKGADVKKILIIVLVLGVLIRILLSVLVMGYRKELFQTIKWSLENPNDSSEPLSPLTFYLISMFAYPLLNLGLPYDNFLVILFVKLPFIIADAITALLLFRAGKKYANEYVGVILSGLVCFCPIFIFASSLWGSVLCLLVPLFVGSMLCIAEKKYVLAIIISDLAIIVAKEGLILFPIFTAYFSALLVKMIIDYTKHGKSDLLKSIILIPATAILSKVAIYLISMPYVAPINGYSYWDFVELIYILPIKNNWYFGENAMNIYSVFGFNTKTVPLSINQTLIAVLFAVFLLAITLVAYILKRNRALILVFATYAVVTVCTYFVGFSALSLFPALAMLLTVFVTTKDKRFLRSFCLTSVLLILLVSVIYVSAGYYNVLPYDLFYATKGYTGSPELNEGAFGVIMIILSVLQVINHIYLTFVSFDITMNNKVKKFETIQKPTAKSVLKEIFTNDDRR